MIVKIGTSSKFKGLSATQIHSKKTMIVNSDGGRNVSKILINNNPGQVEVKTFHKGGTTVQRCSRSDAMRLLDVAAAMGIKLTMRAVV